MRRHGNTIFENNFTAIHMSVGVMIAKGIRDMIAEDELDVDDPLLNVMCDTMCVSAASDAVQAFGRYSAWRTLERTKMEPNKIEKDHNAVAMMTMMGDRTLCVRNRRKLP